MKITVYRQLCRRLQDNAAQDKTIKYKGLTALYSCARLYQRLVRNPYLPVHHRTRSVYVHVPKTGGNSVTNILYGARSRWAGSHRGAWEYLNYSPDWYQQYFVFATVRHPLIRMHSAFYFLKCGGMNARDKRWADHNLAQFDNFYDFMMALKDRPHRKHIMRFLHFFPQSYFLCDATGKPIVTQFVHTEDFEAGMQNVCEKLNIPYAPRHENATIRREIRPGDFDDEPANLCYEIYQRDYDLLGYRRHVG